MVTYNTHNNNRSNDVDIPYSTYLYIIYILDCLYFFFSLFPSVSRGITRNEDKYTFFFARACVLTHAHTRAHNVCSGRSQCFLFGFGWTAVKYLRGACQIWLTALGHAIRPLNEVFPRHPLMLCYFVYTLCYGTGELSFRIIINFKSINLDPHHPHPLHRAAVYARILCIHGLIFYSRE